MADHVGDLDEPPVILFVQGPKDATLDGLQPVRQVRDRAVADDVRGVVEEATVDTAMERKLYLPGNKGTRWRRHSDIFSQDMRGPVAALGRLWLSRFAVAAFGDGRSVDYSRRIVRKLLDRQLRLFGGALAFG
jgi:hypothetical protein